MTKQFFKPIHPDILASSAWSSVLNSRLRIRLHLWLLASKPTPSAIQATTMPYFLLLKLLLWLFVRDEGEIFGKAERLEAPDDLQKIKNRSWIRVENKELFQKAVRVSIKLNRDETKWIKWYVSNKRSSKRGKLRQSHKGRKSLTMMQCCSDSRETLKLLHI